MKSENSVQNQYFTYLLQEEKNYTKGLEIYEKGCNFAPRKITLT